MRPDPTPAKASKAVALLPAQEGARPHRVVWDGGLDVLSALLFALLSALFSALFFAFTVWRIVGRGGNPVGPGTPASRGGGGVGSGQGVCT